MKLNQFANGNTEKMYPSRDVLILKYDFVLERLKAQLSMLPDAIKTNSLDIKMVSNARTAKNES